MGFFLSFFFFFFFFLNFFLVIFFKKNLERMLFRTTSSEAPDLLNASSEAADLLKHCFDDVVVIHIEHRGCLILPDPIPVVHKPQRRHVHAFPLTIRLIFIRVGCCWENEGKREKMKIKKMKFYEKKKEKNFQLFLSRRE